MNRSCAHPIAAGVVLACAAALSLAVQAQVMPPPLPPGSAMVKVEGGLNEAERKRQVRAHHHKFHHKKDYMRDDSVHGDPSEERNARHAAQEQPVITAVLGVGQPPAAVAPGKKSVATAPADCANQPVKPLPVGKAVPAATKPMAAASGAKPVTACDIKKSLDERKARKRAAEPKTSKTPQITESGSSR